MSYTPYEIDLFLSYGHIDNEADEVGWIDRFHKDLKRRLKQLLGTDIEVWRDNQLAHNGDFEQQIEERLQRSAVMVPVLSPRYIESAWCRRELSAFLKRGDGRMFKVVKTRVDLPDQPEALLRMLGYEFFRMDETGRIREIPDFDVDPQAEKRYLQRIDDLAQDIQKILKKLRLTRPGETPPSQFVYLAETSGDLAEMREEIRRELIARGFGVLPDQPLPYFQASALNCMVAAHLVKSGLSIHLIGRQFGLVPEGVTESIVGTQQRLAAERNGANGSRCLIWRHPEQDLQDDRQRQYFENLQSSLREQPFTELLRTSFDTFKAHVFDRLMPQPVPKPQHTPATSAAACSRLIYLLCDGQDRKAATDLQRQLAGRGYNADLPLFDGGPEEIRKDNEASLEQCDAVLLYYGAASEAWIREKVREMRRALGLGRSKPFVARGIVMAPPAGEAKSQFVIPEFTRVSLEHLEPFLRLVSPEGVIQ